MAVIILGMLQSKRTADRRQYAEIDQKARADGFGPIPLRLVRQGATGAARTTDRIVKQTIEILNNTTNFFGVESPFFWSWRGCYFTSKATL